MNTLRNLLHPRRWLTGLWRNPDFVKLWGSLTITHFGGQVTFLALPLTAAIASHWIRGGTADALVEARRQEARERQADGGGQKAHLLVFGDAGGAVALAELGPVGAQDHGHVGELR